MPSSCHCGAEVTGHHRRDCGYYEPISPGELRAITGTERPYMSGVNYAVISRGESYDDEQTRWFYDHKFTVEDAVDQTLKEHPEAKLMVVLPVGEPRYFRPQVATQMVEVKQ
jgi:hypothetical protein